MSASAGGKPSAAAAQKSGGSHRGSGKSSKLMDLDFKSLASAHDDLDEFGIDEDDVDEATTIKPTTRLPSAQLPTSSNAAAPLSKPMSGSSSAAASPATGSAARADALHGAGGKAVSPSVERITAAMAAARGSMQAPAGAGGAELDAVRRESETPADLAPQTEVLNTQLLGDDAPPPQATATVTQLLSQPAAELQQAPDELMHEAQELSQLPAMQSGGHSDGGLPSSNPTPSAADAAEAQTTMQVDATEPTPEERSAAPSVRIPSPLRELASSPATFAPAPAAEADRAEVLPSATLSPRGQASPAARAAPLPPFDLASAVRAQFELLPECLAAPLASASLAEQGPPAGQAQRSPRLESLVEGRAEPAPQSAAALASSAPMSLEKMAAELKKMHAHARNQQIRAQMLINDLMMLASPLHQHRLAELQRNAEEEEKALAAMGQELMPQ